MNLTIDIGNTQTKLGIFDGNGLMYHAIFERLTLSTVKSLYTNFAIDKVILAAVAPYDRSIEEYIEHNSFYLRFDSDTPVPIVNDYQTPHTLGLDRLAGVIGATGLFPNNDILVIDAGTCITFDFLNKDHHYLGGSITPGISIRFRSLNTYTGRLPLLEKEEAGDIIGNSTKQAILSGVLNGIIAEMNGMIRQYEQQFPAISIVLTGGDAQFFESHLESKIFADPNIVLFGLNKIIEFNATRQ